MTIFRHSNYAVPASRTDSFSPIVTSALAPALGQKGAQDVHHPIAQLKTLFNFRFKVMKHPISQNIIPHRFFAGTLAAIFSAMSFSVSLPAFAIAPKQNPVKIFSDDFESGKGKWQYFNDQIVSAPSPVHAGTKSLYYDRWPGTTVMFPPTHEMYLRFWWYLPTGFDGAFKPGRHYWEIGAENQHHRTIDTWASAPNSFNLDHHAASAGGGFFPNAAQLPTGRWFKFEFYSRQNSPGVANGEAALWIDGVEKFHRRNTILTDTGNRYDELWLTANYDYCDNIPRCTWWMDDVEVWNGCPSGSPCNGGSSPVNLAPPSNLRVVPAP